MEVEAHLDAAAEHQMSVVVVVLALEKMRVRADGRMKQILDRLLLPRSIHHLRHSKSSKTLKKRKGKKKGERKERERGRKVHSLLGITRHPLIITISMQKN